MKLTIKAISSLVVLILLSANLMAQCPQPGFNYSLPITINNSNTANTDVQVKLTLNTAALVTAGKMQASCNDMRFTDSLCNVLPYWIESGINTANTVVWVKLKSLPNLGNVRIFMQYGNTAATSQSNGDSTFLLFDDFLGSTLNTSKWNYPAQTGSININNGNINVSTTSSMIIFSNAAYPVPNKTEMNVVALSGTYPCMGQSLPSTINSGVTIFTNSSVMHVAKMSTGCNAYGGYFTNNTMVSGVGIWSLTWTSSDVYTGTWPGNGTFTNTASTGFTLGSSTNSSFGLLCSGTGSISVDWIRVRKNLNNEPTFTLGTELTNTKAYNDAGVASITNLQSRFCAGNQPITVLLNNYGINTISNLTVNWSVNNVLQTPFMQIGAIDTIGSTSGNTKLVNIGNYNFSNTFTSIKVWTSNPNSGVDTVRSNDTAFWSGNSGMGGVYTIGNGGNYTTFAAAINALQTSGLCAPVVFNVLPGTYYEQVNILNEIPDASSTNTITFNGSGVANCMLTYSAYLTTARHTLQISAADYITFQNMTIQGTGTTYAWPVYLTNRANNNTIKKCNIEITAPVNANTGTFNFLGVVAGGAQSSSPGGSAVENLTIDSNNINWATHGIYTYGVSTTSGHQYRGNTILNCDNGITASYLKNIIITGNTIKNRNINANANNGITVGYITPTNAFDVYRISENKITNAALYGINVQYSNALAVGKGLIANNMIGGGFTQSSSRGIYINNSNYWMVYHNSVNHNTTTTSTIQAALYTYNSSNLSVVNNILARTGTGNGMAFYNAGYALDTFANNIFYKLPADTSGGIIYNNATYYPRTLGSIGQGNIYFAPGFTNDTTLTISNRCINGYVNAVVTRDIDGDLRSTPPDIGADELPSSGVDAETSAILWPVSPTTPGLSSVRVQFRNVGGTNLTALRVNYRLNNGPLRSMNWTGNLSTCDTTSIIFTALQQGNFSQSVNSIVAWVDLPNGQADPFPANDTVRTNVYLALSGTYTIGGATADFPDFASAVSALRTSGVGGAVEFLVNPGTYNERVVIDFNILGSSATNTVTFNGGDGNRNTRIITFSNLNSSNQSVVLLQGCRYVTFKNLTIQNTSTSSGYGINVMLVGNTTSNITIKSCKILQLGLGATSTSQYYAGILTSGVSYDRTSVKMDSITIDSNEISGGYYGYYNSSISSTLSLALRITNNTFIGVYNAAVYINYVENVRINYNTITTPEGRGNYGIYCVYINTTIPDYATQIIGNKIPSFISRGIYISNCSNPTTRKGIIANNVIGGGPMTSTTSYGIYMYYTTRWMIHHNTVNMTNPGTTSSTYAAMYFSSGTSTSIVNNIFARTVSGSGHTFYASSSSGIDTFNYNHFYKLDTTAGLLYYGGTRYPATFKNVYGGNANSIFKPTSFVSDSNMQITDECNNGMILGTVLTDINGVTRNTIPDMGAYEIQGVTNDIGVEFIHPLAIPISTGPRQINIRLRNYGANIVGAALIKYSFNNMAPQTVNWSGTLLPCDTANVAFTINIPNGFSRLRIYTVAPNTLTDANFSNDTFERVISTSLSGTYTIGGTTPDFTNFTDAVAALDVAGVSGAVLFNVRPGIYNEQILLNVITGASITNTVTFKAENGNKNSVELRYAATLPTNNYVVKLNATNFVRFKNMTMRATGINNLGNVFSFVNNASQDSIYACNLIGVNTQSTSTDLAIVAATGGKYDYINISSTKFVNGSIGLNLESTTPTNFMLYNSFVADTFENQYYIGANFKTQFLYNFRNNVISTNSSFNGYIGIYTTYSQRGSITGNKITVLNGGAGIFQSDCDGNSVNPTWITNNSISVNGANTSSYGIYSLYSNWQYFYNNSIHVYGAASYSYGVYLFYNTAANSNNKFYNNVVSNSGGGYGYYIYNPTYCTSDYNNFYASNPLFTVQTSVPNSSYSLSTWKTNLRDANSISYRPGFTSDTNLMPNANDSASWSLNGRALPQSSINLDVNGNTRSTSATSGTVDIGAFEFTPTSLPPAATATPANPLAGSTQLFLFGGDTVATITWAVGAPVPAGFSVRAYAGATPPAIVTGNYQFNYTKLDGANGTYNYNLKYYFKDIWMGNVSSKTVLKLAKYNTVNGWSTDNTQIDTSRNILTVTALTKLNTFTGTNTNNPLPVDLIKFNVVNKANHPLLTWSTAAEINSSHFVVERSLDNKSFVEIGKVKSSGNSSAVSSYTYTDLGIELDNINQTVYYRLSIVDVDYRNNYSETVFIDGKQQLVKTNAVYPNPFTKQVYFAASAEKGEVIQLNLMDINGKKIAAATLTISTDNDVFDLTQLWSEFANLNAGAYFVQVIGTNSTETIKLIKF